MTTAVATLICNPAAPALSDSVVARARAVLPGAAAPQWLAPAVAVDIAFARPVGDDASVRAALAAEVDGLPIDLHIGPADGRRKKLLVADMDSTIIAQECIDELADLVGLKDHVASITERAMRGEIAFEPALRDRVALLRGLRATVIDDVFATRITLTPGARTAVRTMRAHGAYTALVSGGFTAFTARVAAMVGFDEHRANRLLIEADAFSGRVAEPILGARAKVDALEALRVAHECARNETMAVGDGANDLPMLQNAGLGVAYHAKPAVAAAAALRIDHGDLTALLYAQGYPMSAFAA